MGKKSLKNTTIFPCIQCGLCCQNVHKSIETKYLDRGDGTCLNFNTEKKLCSIYENRPEICRVDVQYELNYVNFYSWNEFVALNMQACELLQAKTIDCD